MKHKISTLLIVLIMVMSLGAAITAIPESDDEQVSPVAPELSVLDEVPEDVMPALDKLLADEDPHYPSDYDIGTVLADRENLYNEVYEPWKSKAAIHAIAYDDATGFLALGGGYLYDNEVHIYRLNVETGYFDKVWSSGDQIIQSDVMAVAIGDTDVNQLTEIVAGSTDGHIYVFEQRHIYDPFTKTENMFDHVWTSPNMFRVFDIELYDADRDFRTDICAGTWDGLVFFEYTNHSGYPYEEEHWIEYTQTWASGDLNGERITAIEGGDINVNGLPEIVVGTREGTIYVFENAGLTYFVNGQPFPLKRDNHYYLNWSSENYTWSPIWSMEAGELDGTVGEELAIVAQGQGVFTLDWNQKRRTFDYKKVVKDFYDWETFGFWGLDNTVDRVISANNVTYNDPVNFSISVPEPIEYVWLGTKFDPDASVYPYNTGMAGVPDGNFSTFDASSVAIDNATAIIDWGHDEEGTGSASAEPDVIVTFLNNLDESISTDFNFSVSQDGSDFEQISPDHFIIDGNVLKIDVDDALQRRRWDSFQYGMVSVYNDGAYSINSLELETVYNLLTDALSVTIGPLRTDYEAYTDGESELDKIIVGTVTGKLIGIGYNDTEMDYKVFWDSGEEDRFVFGSGIWDITNVHSITDVPVMKMYAPADLFIPPYVNPPSVTYNSMSIAQIDPFGFHDASPYFFVGTRDSEIVAMNMAGNSDSEVNGFLADVNTDLATKGKPYTSVEVPYLYSSQFNFFPVVVVASYDPDDGLSGDAVDSPAAEITFYYRSAQSATADFSEIIELDNATENLDPTGEVAATVALAKTTPKMCFKDIDGDFDLDMIFTTGKLHLAKNMIVENGGVNENNEFVMVHGYFDQVNDEMKSTGWGQPDMYDFDGDGTQDLLLNFAYKNGTTVFLNKGTRDNPNWVEDKRVVMNHVPDTNMKFNNLTDTRIVRNGIGNALDKYAALYDLDIDHDYTVVSRSVHTGLTYWFKPVYDAIDSYVVATYPEVKRTDICLLQSDDFSFRNFGFRIRESWSNEDDLINWSLSIDSGDLDNDGIGEIIVGDYDNNIYAFENLVNQTYKRMWRSFDLNHTEESDKSPYLYEDLEGISGEFFRKIWDHAELLLADVDLDQDGLKELIVTADLQVYVFEDKNLTGGDDLRFVYKFDLRDLSFTDDNEWQYAKTITAIAAGNDLDYDGRKEIVLSAGPYLFTFNVPLDDFQSVEEQGFFVTASNLFGRYYLIGNPLANATAKYAVINALTVGDTDQDGYREIILGGTLDTRYTKDSGFVYIYECVGGTFHMVWKAPEVLTKFNPVSSIILDDQDYDGSQEIIIGHTKGFDIWEWIPGKDSMYQKVEHVTASPNYPIVPLKDLQPASGDAIYDITDMGRSSMAIGQGSYTDYIWRVHTNYSRLWWMWYDTDTGLWSDTHLCFPSDYGDRQTGAREMHPSVCSMGDGNYYLTWKLRDLSGDESLWVAEFDSSSETFTAPYQFKSEFLGTLYHFPRVFEVNNSHIGIVYVYDYFIGEGRSIGYSIFNRGLSSHTFETLDFEGRTDFYVHSIDAVKHADDGYAIAFSAINTDIQKPDYDIYALKLNASFMFENSTAFQVTEGYNDDLYPDIDYLRSDDQSLIVMYEDVTEPFEERIWMVSGNADAKLWGRPDYMNTLPEGMERVEHLDSGHVTYEIEGETAKYWLAVGSSVAGLEDAGFIYSFIRGYTFDIDFGDTDWWFGFPHYGINQQSDWAMNNLWNVEDLDTGDTDGDGRREVFAGFENYVSAYELDSSTDGTGFMSYEEVWLSNEFENEFNDLTVYDASGNGFEEIAIATERGNVYFYEYRTPSEGIVELVYPKSVLNASIPSSSSALNLESYDLDEDGKDEIIATGIVNESIYAIDDDGSIIWQHNNIPTGTLYLFLKDLGFDGVPEVIVSSYTTDYLLAYDIVSGTQLWNFTDPGIDPYDIEVYDINGDGSNEAIVSMEDGSIRLLKATDGDEQDSISISGVSLLSIAIGNFTGSNQTMLAAGDFNGVLRILNLSNKTVIYESPPGTVKGTWQPSNLVPYDIDDDNIDELFFGSDRLHILDVVEKAVVYNSTYYGTFDYEIYIEDFDGDNVVEVLSQTINGLFLEEIEGGVTQWQYNPEQSHLWDISIANLTGDSTPDIACIGLQKGVIALDGRTGTVLWFTNNVDPTLAVTAADLDGDGIDSIASGTYTGTLRVYDSQLPSDEIVDDIFTPHSNYLEIDVGDVDVRGMKVRDMNKNGFDEIVTLDKDSNLTVWNGTTGSLIWKLSFSDPVKDFELGNVDDSGWTDVIVRMGDGRVVLFKGESGSQISSIPRVDDFVTRDMEVRNFDGSVSGEELLVMYESGALMKTFLVWYDFNGNELHRSNVNITNVGCVMAAGYYTGSATLDIAVGGKNAQVFVYSGANGNFQWSWPLGSEIRNIVPANFNGDSYVDFAVLDNVDNVHVVDASTHITVYSKYYDTDAVKSVYAANVFGNFRPELVVDIRKQGVIAYDFTGTQVWIYEAPLMLHYPQSPLLFDDFNEDGRPDMVYVNYDYINLINTNTGSMDWHYVTDTGFISKPVAGHLQSDSGIPDIVYMNGNKVVIVSGRETPLVPPSPPIVMPGLTPNMFAVNTMIVAGISSPIFLLVAVPIWKRRRKGSKDSP